MSPPHQHRSRGPLAATGALSEHIATAHTVTELRDACFLSAVCNIVFQPGLYCPCNWPRSCMIFSPTKPCFHNPRACVFACGGGCPYSCLPGRVRWQHRCATLHGTSMSIAVCEEGEGLAQGLGGWLCWPVAASFGLSPFDLLLRPAGIRTAAGIRTTVGIRPAAGIPLPLEGNPECNFCPWRPPLMA